MYNKSFKHFFQVCLYFSCQAQPKKAKKIEKESETAEAKLH